MDEKLEELKKCLKTANEAVELARADLESLPDFAKLDQKRCELKYYYEYAQRCLRDTECWEKDIWDFMNAHLEYKEKRETYENMMSYHDDIVRAILKMGYEWDAARQDFVKMAA